MEVKTKMLGSRIRQIRKSKKWSMKELAEKVGVSFSYIAKIETGENAGSIDVIERIAAAFSISPGVLMQKDVPVEKLVEISAVLERVSQMDEDQIKFINTVIDQLQKTN